MFCLALHRQTSSLSWSSPAHLVRHTFSSTAIKSTPANRVLYQLLSLLVAIAVGLHRRRYYLGRLSTHHNGLAASWGRGTRRQLPSERGYSYAGWLQRSLYASRPSRCKVPRPWEEYKPALQVERRIFKRLEEHPTLVKVIETDEYSI
jgi:hypothetical protein